MPPVVGAAVNLGEDADGLMVDVLSLDSVRLHLSTSLDLNGTVTLDAGLSDYAGNVASALVIDPTE